MPYKIGTRLEPARVAFVDGNDPEGLPRGYYQMSEDGKDVDGSMRLRWVDDAPDNPEDWSGHFEVMAPEAGYGYFHGKGSADVPVEESEVVPLAAEVEGKSDVSGESFLDRLRRGK